MTDFSPREIVSELERNIVGQGDAKRAVASSIAQSLAAFAAGRQIARGSSPEEYPDDRFYWCRKDRNIASSGQARRTPFLKVEATKFTEVGYVGGDVERIVRDLVEIGIALVRDRKRKDVQARAEQSAEERVLNALVGPGASPATRESFRKKLRDGKLDGKEIEIEFSPAGAACQCSKFPACRARRWARSISAISSASLAEAAPRPAVSRSRETLF